jgi:hypothetical protein
MKKLMCAFCFLFGGLVAVNAQDTTSNPQQNQQYPTSTQQEDQDREKINSRDLPDAVKRSLETQEYRGWLVNAAYKTKGVSDQPEMNQGDTTSVSDDQNQNQNDTASANTGAYGQEVFVVELKNGAQTKTVRFDKDGNKLDDPGMKDDQK